jgi:outer membrane protein assembly factor BamB
MRRSLLTLLAATLALAACGSGGPDYAALARNSAPVGHRAAAATPYDWPMFGLNPQRTSATDDVTGITAANVAGLQRHVVVTPGIVDSEPVFLHGVTAGGATRDVFIAETTYGRVVAIDADSGQIVWRFDPPGTSSLIGSPQITTASPAVDPGRAYVYTTSPNGYVHKLSVADGSEAAGWPARITQLPSHEKLTAGLNIAGGYVLATTGGYFGDAPPYQGHIVAISRSSGRIASVFNSLCANRRAVIQPSSCAASDSAILSRSGPVVEPGGTRVLFATGNGPYNGSTNFGDSVIELNLPSLTLRQVYTPRNQAMLNTDDLDLGSASPALLPGGLLLQGGKDGVWRVLTLQHLNGRNIGRPYRTGGEVQTLPAAGGAEVFSEPAVWHNMVFVATSGGTIAYRVSGGRLHTAWQNGTPGTTPVVAGGLLYIYDMNDGGLYVRNPASGHVIAKLPSGSGHWSSPIVVAGKIALGEGGSSANNGTTGALNIYS